MFSIRYVFRCRNHSTNFICTSSVFKCNKSKNSNKDFLKKESVSETKAKANVKSSPGKENKRQKKSKLENVYSLSDKILTQKWSENAHTPSRIFKTEFFNKVLASSAESVAQDLGGDKEETKKELLNYLKTFKISRETKQLNADYSDSIVDYNISLRALFKDSPGLNIFVKNKKKVMMDKPQVKLKIWEALEQEELEYLSKVHPRNHFEELIKWTEEGKLWHFPIDNDQGMEEEAKFNFTQHIFLEKHLEPWCPKRGPLRKFMELVLIGLGKNYIYTVEEKIEHIKWFENYFERKKKLLQELGAVGAIKELTEGTSPEETS